MSDLCIVDPSPIEQLPDIFQVLATPVTKFNATAEAHYEHTLSLFVRLGSNVITRARGVDVIIATVNNTAATHGQGALTRLLNKLEPRCSVAFESVINPRLVGFLMRRGYRPYPEDYTDPIDTTFWIRRK